MSSCRGCCSWRAVSRDLCRGLLAPPPPPSLLACRHGHEQLGMRTKRSISSRKNARADPKKQRARTPGTRPRRDDHHDRVQAPPLLLLAPETQAFPAIARQATPKPGSGAQGYWTPPFAPRPPGPLLVACLRSSKASKKMVVVVWWC